MTKEPYTCRECKEKLVKKDGSALYYCMKCNLELANKNKQWISISDSIKEEIDRR